MKTKIFLISLFISVIAFAQVPTSGLMSEYEFTNGSLTDPINGDDFVQTGSALLAVSDKFGSNSNAIDLNGDYLTRPSINYSPDVSLSFWLKTTTNDANVRTVLDDKSTTSGFVIYLQDGKVGISATHERSPLGWPITYRSFNFLTNTVISDGEWHHVVVTIDFDEIRNIANQLRGHTFNIDFHIDLVTESFVDSTNGTTLNSLSNTNNLGNVTVANNRTNTLIVDNRYLDEIDDIHFYNRLLTNAEVEDVSQNGGYCFAPEFIAAQVTNITETTFDITFPEAGNFDVAYVPSGEPIANAIITSVTSTISTHTISGLNSSSIYDIYIREECSMSYDSDWSESVEIRTDGVIYVNAAATGSNNGTSFTDGFVDLQDALAIVNNDQDIWIAKGTYTPDASDRYVSFLITNSGVKIYGGFDPSDTQLTQRDYRTNETILSGDLLANDNATIAFSEATRNDNSYKVVYVNASNFTIDGVTIADGHGDSTLVTYQSGSGLTKEAFKTNLTIENCTFKNNVAITAAAGIFAEYKAPNGSGYLKITNSIFDNNLSRYGTAIYSYTNGITNSLTVDVVNSLFTNNKATDNGANLGLAGSAGWIRAYNSGSTVTSTFINNTYANNKDDGTGSSLTNTTRGTLGIGQNLGIMNSSVYNCIFWNNKSRGTNTTAKSISAIITSLPSSISIGNAIDEDDFSLISAGDKVNTSAVDPLFTDSGNNDFTLQSSSPAINTGDSSKIPTGITTDLLGNTRIYNGAVDMGPYEKACTATCYTLTLNIIGSGAVSNSGINVSSVSSFPANASLSLTPNALIGNQFLEWTGDATGNTNPLAITMDSDKTINAMFIELPLFVDKDATGNNDGSSWANAYTDLNVAISNVGLYKAIWIAEGTYTPTLGSRSNSFTLSKDDLKIYGGFNGTETNPSQRDIANNPTILSGDLNGDDDTNISYNNTTRDDNSLRIVYVTSNNVTIDGVTIANGYADATTGEGRYGAGLSITTSVGQFTLVNSVIEQNVAWWAAGLNLGSNINGSSFNISSCTFKNNLSSSSASFYAVPGTGNSMNISVTNSLFKNNTTKDNGTSRKGYGASAGWFRAYYTGSSIHAILVNNTYVNNVNEGTGVSNFPTVGLSTNQGSFGSLDIANNIFWGNTLNGGITALAFGKAADVNTPSSTTIYNSIDEDNFSNFSSKVGVSNANPLFTNDVGGNYTLQSGSPAIDTGDNTKLPVGITTDLLNNTRVYNTTIDMGCYEYDPSLVSIVVSPKVYLQGAALNPNTGEETLMRDDLRIANYVPSTSPYTDGLMCDASVFTVTGPNAIVDWVLIELRDANSNTTILHSQSALLQRDGDVVGVDGISGLSFSAQSANYYVAVKHRNHLSIMSASSIALSGVSTTVDFTNSTSQITYGTEAQTTLGMQSGIVGMWSGDSDGNGSLNYIGAQSEVPNIESQVFNDPANSFFGGPPVATYGSLGYNVTDVNMDGLTYYSGALSDALFIRDNIFNNPSNSFFGGPPVGTYTFNQQMP